MPKPKPRIQAPSPREEAAIRAAIQADPDNPEWTEDDFARARPASEVLPEIFGQEAARALLRPRGRPRSAMPKVRVGLRLSPDVVQHFKEGGEGWQTRIDSALRQFIAEHPRTR